MKSALDFYERALSDLGGAGPIQVRFRDGHLAPMPVARYLAGADAHDRELLADVAGPVIDVGCGPGRHLAALTSRGVFALGVDISPVAVARARRGGSRAVVADVFGVVPGAGTWATALLLDGNIGIGGQPDRLLSRLGALLCADGVILAELEPPQAPTGTALARIEAGGDASDWFPWARVSVSEISDVAADAGMTVERTWQCGERWFARLRSAPGG
jgi:SAM-dependent methyltransferase